MGSRASFLVEGVVDEQAQTRLKLKSGSQRTSGRGLRGDDMIQETRLMIDLLLCANRCAPNRPEGPVRVKYRPI
jgi:hypothetical protein